MKKTVRIGTRGSALAMTQTRKVASQLENAYSHITCEIITIKTEGDIDRTSSLASFGGRGAFVKRIETALIEDEIDLAVHSLKDLPSELPEGLALASVPERLDPRDALVTGAGSLDDLGPGGVIGTGSDRRAAQLAERRPDLEFRGIRGNVDTRLDKLDNGGYDALILACSGLERLKKENRITERIDPDIILPAPCQGAIGIESRADDTETIAIVRAIEDNDVRVCVDAERAFINRLGMGCHAPVGALAENVDSAIRLRVYLSTGSGGPSFREDISASTDTIQAAACTLADTLREKAE